METTKQTPVQGTGNNPETFTVSRETAYFLTALKSFEQAKSDYFTALTEYYGEGQGANMYNEHWPDLDRDTTTNNGRSVVFDRGQYGSFEEQRNITKSLIKVG